MRVLRLQIASVEALIVLHKESLAQGRAMVPWVEGVQIAEECHLDIRAQNQTIRVPVVVRWVPNSEAAELGVEFMGFDTAAAQRLAGFVKRVASKDKLSVRNSQRTGSTVQELKGLPMGKIMKLAKTGTYNQRVALERLYGKSAWDSLLKNPQITAPEVAKIARKGTVPRPTLERILANRAWVRNAAVRRALLSNLKLGVDAVNTLLRATPKSELRLVPQQTAYPQQVRQLAKKYLGLG